MRKMFERIGMKGVAPALVGVAAMALSVSPAFADLIFDLNTPNAAVSGLMGPYVQVDVHLNTSTSATVTFTSLTNSGNIYLLGDGGSVGLNISGGFSLNTITGSNAGTGFTPGPWTDSGAGTEDGFGSFNLTVTSFDGFSHSSDTITLGITATGLTTWTDSTFLTPNSGNNTAAAHIFVTSSPANSANGALVTGFVSNGSQTQVSEPSTLMLLGSGIVGFAYLTVRRRRAAQS